MGKHPADYVRVNRSRQRGAAAVFAGISVIMGLICLALAWDLGRMYFVQRDLQRMANVAALDAARAAGGCITAVTNPLAVASAEAAGSVVRNGGEAGWVSVAVGLKGGNGGVRFFEATRNDKNRAVLVTLTRPMPARLVPLLGTTDGPTTMIARAAAWATPSATVSMGTEVLAINPNSGALNSLLGGLLGAPLSLDVLTYRALFASSVPVASLLDALNITNADQLANATTSAADLLTALGDQLASTGQAAAASGVRTLAAAASSTPNLPVSEVLGINDPNSGAALSAGQIVMSASETAFGSNLLNLGGGVIQLSLTQPALPTLLIPGGIQLFPENFASNTQLQLAVNALPINIALPGLATVGSVSLFAQAGQGTAEIDHLTCARRSQPNDLAWVRARTSVLRVGIGKFDNMSSPNPTPGEATILETNGTLRLGPLSLPVPVGIKITAYAEIPIDVGSGYQNLPPLREGETYHMGTPRIASIVSNVNASLVTVNVNFTHSPLSGLLNGLLNTTKTALETALKSQLATLLATTIDATVLPLLDSAGVTVGGADVTVTDIEAPQPYLFTH